MRKLASLAAVLVALSAIVVAVSWQADAKQATAQQPRDFRGQNPPLPPGQGFPGDQPPLMQPQAPRPQQQPIQPVMLQDKDGRALYVLMGNALFRVDTATFKQSGVVMLSPPRPRPDAPRGEQPGGPVTDAPDKN